MKKVIYPIATVLLIILMWLLSSQRASPQKPAQKVTIVKIIDDSSSAEDNCQKYILEKSAQGYKLIDFEPFVDGSTSYGGFIIVMEK